MQEMHHRVKNNLQIISSLLSMQQRTLNDPASRAALGDTRQRISALALIYRTLYQSHDLRHADAGHDVLISYGLWAPQIDLMKVALAPYPDHLVAHHLLQVLPGTVVEAHVVG